MYEENPEMEMKNMFMSPMGSFPKVSLLGLYNHTSIVMKIGVPRGTLFQTRLLNTSCIQDSMLQKITLFNKHKVVW